MRPQRLLMCAAVAAALLGAGGVTGLARPADDDSPPNEALLDDLAGLRAEEEILRMTRDAERQQLQTWLQMGRRTQAMLTGGMMMGMGGMPAGMMNRGVVMPGGQPIPEEQQKQMEKQQKDAQAARDEQFEQLKRDFIESSKELARVQRRRAALEKELGIEPDEDSSLEARVGAIERRLEALTPRAESARSGR